MTPPPSPQEAQMRTLSDFVLCPKEGTIMVANRPPHCSEIEQAVQGVVAAAKGAAHANQAFADQERSLRDLRRALKSLDAKLAEEKDG